MLDRAYDLVLRLPAFRGKTKIESALRRLLRPSVSKVSHGLVMELDPEEWLQVDLRAAGRVEPATIALFERILHPGDTYVDVGAHVGYHCLVARRLVGDSGRVLAIDPQPYNCAKILGNAERNGFANIVVVVAAAGDSDGFVTLRAQSRRDTARLTLAGAGVNDRPLPFVVPKITLSWLFKSRGLRRVALLKIDVEGSEYDVLQGARDVIGAVDNIIFEALPDARSGRAVAAAELLQSEGFELYDVNGVAWQQGRSCPENNIWARRP